MQALLFFACKKYSSYNRDKEMGNYNQKSE